MEEKIPCACCGHPVSGESWPMCGYCGYVHVAVVGSATRYDRLAQEHRTEVISRLTGISVLAYQYGWSEGEQRYKLLDKRELALVDGPACDGDVFWTGQRFGQTSPFSLELSYTYDGSRQRVTRSLQPPACAGYWDLGLEINSHLELVVHLGDKQSSSKSQPIPFIQKGGEAD